MGTHDLGAFEPVYRDLPGWEEDVQSARRWEDLPPAVQDYIRAVEEESGAAVGWISVGAERTQLVIK